MSRRLFATLRSPFARKVRILLVEKDLPFEVVPVDLTARSPEFVELSPLGKVPVLVDGDTTVFDSTVIAEYLEDRYPAPPLLGSSVGARLAHRAIDELADTVAEQAVTLFFAHESGPPALAKANRLLDRALDEVTVRLARGELSEPFGLGHAAVISALGYLAFRHGPQRIDARPGLGAFVELHASRMSVLAAPPPRE